MSKAQGYLDAAYRLRNEGRRHKAAQAALEGIQELETKDDPQLAADLCIAAINFGMYSACYAPDLARKLYEVTLGFCPDNQEILFRQALLNAREELNLENLEILGSLRHDSDRNMSAFKIAVANFYKDRLNTIAVPYDNGELWVHADIKNITAFVLLETEDWFEEEINLFRELCAPGVRVLDFGANVGVYSYSAAIRGAMVKSIEPVKENYDLLCKNKGDYKDWFTGWGAISDKAGLCTFVKPENMETGKGNFKFKEGDKVLAVPVATIDGMEFNRYSKIDIVKLDVEGQELNAIRGGRRFFLEQSPVLIYEVKDQAINFEVISEFEAMGYDSYVYNAHNNTLRPLDKNEIDPFLINIVGFRKDRKEFLEKVVDIR